MKQILVTPGEPAGIGPELALRVCAGRPDVILIADPELLKRRLSVGGAPDQVRDRSSGTDRTAPSRIQVVDRLDTPAEANAIRCWPVPLAEQEQPGRLNPSNAVYVLECLQQAADFCLNDEAAALVTGPVHKGVINDAGHAFTGHTEFLAQRAGADRVVMMLVSCPTNTVANSPRLFAPGGVAPPRHSYGYDSSARLARHENPLATSSTHLRDRTLAAGRLRVALATTHLPLREVADAITPESLTRTLEILHRELRDKFRIERPVIAVLGLNPHAGEGGHLGREEIEIIGPVLARLRESGMDLRGPLPADTAFVPSHLETFDAVCAMYHDQGLPVLKHAGFGHAVNVTLGLPFVRTSVDHGTALDLAGTGRADAGSLVAALDLARFLGTRDQGPGTS